MAMMEVILNLVDNLSAGMDSAENSIESFTSSTEGADDKIEGLGESTNSAADNMDEFDAILDEVYGTTDELAAALGGVSDGAESADEAVNSIDPASLDNIESAADEAGISVESIQEAAAHAGTEIGSITPTPVQETGKAADDAAQGLDEAAGAAGLLEGAASALIAIGIVDWLDGAANAAGSRADDFNRLAINVGFSAGEVEEFKAKYGGAMDDIRSATNRGMGDTITMMSDLGRAGIRSGEIMEDTAYTIAGLAHLYDVPLKTVSTNFRRAISSGEGLSRVTRSLGLSVEDLASSLGMSADEFESSFKAADKDGRAKMLNDALSRQATEGNEAYADSWALVGDALGRAYESISMMVGKLILPYVIPAVKLLTSIISGLVKGINDLPGPIKSVMGIFTLIAGAVGTVGGLFIALKASLVVLAPLFAPLTTIIGNLLAMIGGQGLIGTLSGLLASIGPVGWAILALTGAVLAGIYIWQTWSKEITKFKDLIWKGDWAGAAGMIGDSFNYVKDAVWNALNSADKTINDFFAALPGMIGNFTSAFYDAGLKFVEWLLKGLTSLNTGLDKILEGMLAPAGEGGKKGGTKAGEKSGEGIIEGFLKWADTNGPKIAEILSTVFLKILPILAVVIFKIMAILGGKLTEGGTKAGQGLWNGLKVWISKLPGRIWAYLLNAIARVRAFGNRARALAIQAGMRILKGVVDFVKKLPGNIWRFLLNTAARITNFGRTAYNRAKSAGQRIWDGIKNQVSKIPGMVYKELLRIGGRIVSVGSTLYEKARKLGEGIWQKFKKGMGIGSPGHMYWLIHGELERLSDVLESKRSTISTSAAKLGNSVADSFNTELNKELDGLITSPQISVDPIQMETTTKLEISVKADLENVPSGNSDRNISNMIIDGLKDRRVMDELDKQLSSTQRRNQRTVGA